MTAQTVPEGGPLTGLRVLELGTLLAGPFAGRLLGDLGAEVIKVEAPGKPDPIRDWGKARYEGRSLWWPVQSRNKKCVTLDLRQRRGQELLLRLVEHADVVTEDLVFLLESMGHDTGIDMEKLLAARKVLSEGLPGEALYGHVPDAGLPKTFGKAVAA